MGKKRGITTKYTHAEYCNILKNLTENNIICEEKYINANVAMEWLNYSPSSAIQPPKGEIWIIKQEDRKEYEKSCCRFRER